MTTLRPSNAVEHLTVDARLLLDRRLGIAVQEAQLGAEQTHAFGRRPTRRAGAAAPSWTLASTATACPSAVAPGPVHCAMRAASSRALPTARCACSASGDDRHRAAGTVDHHRRTGRHRVQPVHRHHARNAELAGDDRGVAGRAAQRGGQRHHQRRIQARGVSGRQILGAQHRGHIRHRDPGFGQPGQLSEHPVADIPQIGHRARPSGHRPWTAHRRSWRWPHRRHGGPDCLPLIRFSASRSQARSWASAAVVASTSEATPVAWAARSRSRSATAAAAALSRSTSPGRSALGEHIGGGHRGGRPRSRPDHRGVGDPGHHRNAGQDLCLSHG